MGDLPAKENPKQFLLRVHNKQVRVVLKWNQIYEGVLVSTDNYFNILLSNAVEVKDKASIGDVSIRCNNIKLIEEIMQVDKGA